LLLSHCCLCRLAKTVQSGTENCPEKAKTMQLKLHKMDAPFKQVLSSPACGSNIVSYFTFHTYSFKLICLFNSVIVGYTKYRKKIKLYDKIINTRSISIQRNVILPKHPSA